MIEVNAAPQDDIVPEKENWYDELYKLYSLLRQAWWTDKDHPLAKREREFLCAKGILLGQYQAFTEWAEKRMEDEDLLVEPCGLMTKEKRERCEEVRKLREARPGLREELQEGIDVYLAA